MKKVIVLLLAACLVLSLCACGNSGDTVTINVFMWGQNMADGSDDSTDIIAEFEAKYPNIKVKVTTYGSNEELYTKLSTGGVSYDVIMPSDYMAARLIAEGYVQEINFDNVSNYALVDDELKSASYDPEGKYTVPYTTGTVGIIYNQKYVDPADVGGWDLLWNPKYADKILMFGNPRDAFAIAEARLGYSLNTENEAELRACAELLKEQRPLVQQYVMDEIYDAMQNEEAYIAAYYAGDCTLMQAENPDLKFYYPEGETFNFFADVMCIPTTAKHKDAAETFINFLTDPEISAANMEWIGYRTPVSSAKDYLDEEIISNPAVYPDEETLSRGEMFKNLSAEAIRLMDSLWLEVTTEN